ncbi:MAG: hypothetical protein ABIK89_22405 [Planctomycetota bacterium]
MEEKKAMSKDVMNSEVVGVSREEFASLVKLANDGDEAALDHLRHILDENPQIWQRVGDLATHAEMALIQTIANGNKLLAESLTRKIAEMKEELAGPAPTRLEELAVQRIIVCWLECQWADACFPSPATENLPVAKFVLKLKESAMTRFTKGMKAMELARRLLPSTVVVPVAGHQDNGHTGGSGHHKNGGVHNGHTNGQASKKKKKARDSAKTGSYANRMKLLMPEPANSSGPSS